MAVDEKIAPPTPVLAPGPQKRPTLQQLRELRKNLIDALYNSWRLNGDLVRFTVAGRVLHLASTPELAEEVLVKHKDTFVKIHQPDGRPVGLQLAVGFGLLTNGDHDSWLSQRRMMQPMFHRKSIAGMAAQMTAAGERLLQRWTQYTATDAPLDISGEMMRLTLDVVNRTMFSSDVLASADRVGPAVTELLHFTFMRQRQGINLPLWLPLPQHRRFHHALATLDGLLYGLIDARREERRQSTERHGDLLDMLLDARDDASGEGMTDKQLRDEVATIFGAGHETTANALTWTWYLLALHPAVRERLWAEVDTVLQGRTPTMDDLPNLPYTQAVFEEALRLYPPAPIVPRQTTHAAVLGGCAIPAHTRVIVSIYNIQRHPAYWEQPDAFMPERFLPGYTPPAELRQHKLAYMPFGAGPRMCIGNNFAMIEGQLLLAQLAARYDLRLAQDAAQAARVEKEFAITMRPRGGMAMTLHPRG